MRFEDAIRDRTVLRTIPGATMDLVVGAEWSLLLTEAADDIVELVEDVRSDQRDHGHPEGCECGGSACSVLLRLDMRATRTP